MRPSCREELGIDHLPSYKDIGQGAPVFILPDLSEFQHHRLPPDLQGIVILCLFPKRTHHIQGY